MTARSVEYIKGCAKIEECPQDGAPEIAFIGRSNVGKSSLINFLLGRKIAYVSGTPGKTQLIHFFRINQRFYLVDLPGYGYARAPREERARWGPMVESYLLKRNVLRGIVFLIDIRHSPQPLDLQMKEWLDHYSLPTLYVVTKGDKIGWGKRKERLNEIKEAFDAPHLLLTSVQAKEGGAALWKEIEKLLLEKAPI
ncbi:MAG TPA: ribosome biogenesis GTP-binding protein YihA/YsxC [Candidatus Manganitrophaceae bacterium]|nr:ribosome biogenesis GTP-binding protein YihA/YsxC [Candidatus Manganitrophaceae bacterium]